MYLLPRKHVLLISETGQMIALVAKEISPVD